jgi:hypothetical protein
MVWVSTFFSKKLLHLVVLLWVFRAEGHMLEFWSARNRSITVGAAENPCRVESEPALPRLWRERHQNPDPAHALALLCARCERPSRRAAEKRDELAPPHLTHVKSLHLQQLLYRPAIRQLW